MKSITRQYLFGAVFIGFAVYQAVTGDWPEFALYFTAGLAFVFNTLTLEPKLFPYKKMLVTITWILIGATGILFLYLLQFRYF